MTFASLRLAEPLLAVLSTEGYATPTPIQARAIPPILAGKDLLGCAQTGTGKTAAFALPLLQRVMIDSPHRPAVEPHRKRFTRALILAPTRELASQIGQSVRTYGGKTGVRYAVIFGGVGQGQQVEALRSGVDVLIATPGRLLDLMNQGHVELKHIEFFVLDEADRMLDMGFIHDIRKVVAKLPAKRQNLLFSATMPSEIRQLANSILHEPEYVEVAPVSSTAEQIEQSVYHVRKENKPTLLAHLYDALPMSRTLVFTRTKHGADRLVRKLRGNSIIAEAIHGNKAQNARQRSLSNFKSGKIAMLVATDIAARGIDVDGVSHVINYDIPNEPETYVHRIGRTGRAGNSGVAIAFCDDGDERSFLRDIEKLIRKKIDVRTDHPAYEQNHKLKPMPRDDHAPRHERAHKPEPKHHRGQGVRKHEPTADQDVIEAEFETVENEQAISKLANTLKAFHPPSTTHTGEQHRAGGHGGPGSHGGHGKKKKAHRKGGRPTGDSTPASHLHHREQRGSASHAPHNSRAHEHGSRDHGSHRHSTNQHGANQQGANHQGSRGSQTGSHRSNAERAGGAGQHAGGHRPAGERASNTSHRAGGQHGPRPAGPSHGGHGNRPHNRRGPHPAEFGGNHHRKRSHGNHSGGRGHR